MPSTYPATTQPDLQPFRLLDLPQEIQDNVYCQYHGSYDIELERKRSGLPGQHRPLILRNMPMYINLELSCRKIRQDSSNCRKRCYTGVLKLDTTSRGGWRRLRELAGNEESKWILAATTFFYFHGPSLRRTQDFPWEQILSSIPRLVHLEIQDRSHILCTRLLRFDQHLSQQYENGGVDAEYHRWFDSCGLDMSRGRFLQEERSSSILYKHILKLREADVHIMFEATSTGWKVVERKIVRKVSN